MEKITNQKAWLLVLPVFALVAFSAVIPLMTVVNYSVQDTFGNNAFFWNVVGTIWQIFGRSDIGLLGWALNRLGFDYNYVANPLDAWLTIIVMDVWHWSSLVALLCYAGLKSIPDAYYQAASIDGASRWAVFTAIQLPKMRHVLVIAALLRFMDSFMIYTEPFVVTGGGPGNSTTFVSIELVKLALGQFDLGKAAAMSIVYMLIIIIVCWVFFTVMTNAGQDRKSAGGEP